MDLDGYGRFDGWCLCADDDQPQLGNRLSTDEGESNFNPTAGERVDPVEGQDGVANATAMGTYRKSFEKPDAEFQRSIVSTGVQTK
jgi:hypothetical protein